MLLQKTAAGAVVTRAWAGKTVVCLASGPSVTLEQIELLRAARERDQIRVVVTNDMYLVAPWADVLYFADERWWGWHTRGESERSWPWARFKKEELPVAFAAFKGQKVTIANPLVARGDDIFILKNHGSEGLSEKQDGVHTGCNSGYQALNIAALSGGSPILLLGIDMRFVNGRSHSHSGHTLKTPETDYHEFAKKFDTTKTQLDRVGLPVFNCSPISQISTFTRGDLASLLAAA